MILARINALAALMAALAVLSSPALAVSLDGEWRGSGTVQVTNGNRERVTCRVSYSRQSSRVYGFHAVCASTSVRVIQNGVVSQASANSYVGTTHNPEYNVSGRIRIVVSGGSQTVTVRADQGSGRIVLRKR